MSRRDLDRAIAGYDEAFERKLVAEIMEAIASASMLSDGDGHRVLALRLGETANALTTILAGTLALSPASTRSRAAIKQVGDSVRRKLLARVRQAESDPLFSVFRSRCFRDDDRERGGHA
jgi:hypothetical protein